MNASVKVALDDILAAKERLAGELPVTPCVRSEILSQQVGAEVFLKLETLQQTGSFKPRGALNRLLNLDAAGRRAGVVAASAGNHAQGVAFAAARIGVEARIVMPEPTPLVKITRTRALGAEVIRHGQTFDEAYEHAEEIARQHGHVFIPAFDDPWIIAGQGTVGLEILDQVPGVEAIVVPIGGGGLISGIATAVKARQEAVEILGVQTEAAPAMQQSFATGTPQSPPLGPTIAEGIAIKHPGTLTFPIIQRLVDDVALVSESEIETAVYELLADAKLLTEGAGAAGAAALLNHRWPRLEGRRVVVVLCGANIDLNLLEHIIQRALVRQHRLVRLRVSVADRPGALAALLRHIGRQEANVLHIEHDRFDPGNSLWRVEVELTLETRDREHIDALFAALLADGYEDAEELALKPLTG